LLCGWLLFYSAARRLALPELTTIYFVAPAITVLLSIFFLGERVSLGRWLAILIGLLGVIVAAHPGGNVPLLPVLMTLGAAGAWASSSILGRLISQSESSNSQIIFANGLFLVVCGLASFPIWRMPTGVDFTLMAGVALAGGLAQLAMFEGFRYAPASLTAPTEYSSLVWSFLLGFIVFGQTPSPQVWVGALLISGGGLALIWTERHHFAPPDSSSDAIHRID
jgi:drug/metabolite transporter (DMT)-like permease